MSRSTRLRAAALPGLAAALICGALGLQLVNGGGDFTPLRSADPCDVRSVTSVSPGIDGLTERLVVLGLDGAACKLGISREALILQLAQPGVRSGVQIDALRGGLLQAVDRMQADGTLPPAADLANEALDRSDLNGLLKAAIRTLPDSSIDKVLTTDDVLRRVIGDLDLRDLLANLHDPDDLTQQIDSAVTQAVEQSIVARVRSLL